MNSSNENQQPLQPPPINSLEMDYRLIEPAWPELSETLKLLQRDVRMGNIKRNEVATINYFLTLAMDVLNCGPEYREAAYIVAIRGIVPLETSQSIDGTLRKRLNTVTRENIDNKPQVR